MIGACLIVGGFAAHLTFEAWVAPAAGRIEMGRFAWFELVLLVVGLVLTAASLARARGGPRAVGWGLWVATALLTGLAVLRRLPP